MSLHHRLRTAAGSPSDPYWSNTSLLLLGNGTNGGQNNTFTDSSSNSFTITRYGNVTQGSFSPFTIATGTEYSTGTNGGSGYFDGSGDYLEIAANSAIQFGTGDYTIEFWVYPLQSGRQDMIDMPGTNRLQVAYEGTNTAIYINQTFIAGSAVAPTVNAWNHIAATRSGTNTRVFLNGTQLGSTATNSTNFSDNSLKIVDTTSGTTPLKGYMAGVRVVKGGALYTAGYTVPTLPPTTTVSSGTVGALLNFTNAAILDSTGKNNLETVGDAQISTSTKKFGTGSLKFDGTGDYLQCANSSNFAFGSGDFTVEFWFYTSSFASSFGIVNTTDSTTAAQAGQWYCVISNSTTLRFGRHGDNQYSTGAATFNTNTWHHVAITRQGTTVRFFNDGVSLTLTDVGGGIGSYNFSNTSNFLMIGVVPTLGYINGYIDDLRITKGVARYTAAFTPPTRQLPAR